MRQNYSDTSGSIYDRVIILLKSTQEVFYGLPQKIEHGLHNGIFLRCLCDTARICAFHFKTTLHY